MPRPFLACLFGVLLVGPSHAQPAADSVHADSGRVDETLQKLLDERPDGTTPTQLVERLTRLASDPLDVNTASASALSTLPPLSLARAHRIVRHRAEKGPFSSVDGLVKVTGIRPQVVRLVRPYVVARSRSDDEAAYASVPSVTSIMSDLDVEVIQRATRNLDLGRGFSDDTSHTTFQGSPVHLTTRLRLQHERRAQLALTLDKDPGEAFRWAPEKRTFGFDHVAGNFALQDMGRLETLVVGDYTTQFGQGLTLWQGISFGKGRDPVAPLREGRGIVPFESTSEDTFFRGLATSVSISPSVSISGFASRRRRDASLDSSAVSGGDPSNVPARTLSTGGLHRTDSEIGRKGAFGTTTLGGAVTYRSHNLTIGAVGYRSVFDRPLRPGNRPDRRFDLTGTTSSMVSTHATAYLGDYVLFGEVARAQTGAVGVLGGAALDSEAGLEAMLLGRRYPPTFNGLFGGAFADSGEPQNEVGIYMGLRVQLAENWWVGGYVDQYRFPWLRFGVPRPTTGFDTRFVVEAKPRPWLSSYIQIRTQREPDGSEERGPDGRLLESIRKERRHAARWHIEYEFSEHLTLQTRIEGSRFKAEGKPPSHGLLLYQGLGMQIHPNLKLNTRFALFDTDGFESRIFAYEHDLLYSFSVPAFSGTGQRSYVLLRYTPTSTLTLETKYGITWHPDRQLQRTGSTAAENNRDREIRIQLRWNL